MDENLQKNCQLKLDSNDAVFPFALNTVFFLVFAVLYAPEIFADLDSLIVVSDVVSAL